MHVEEIRKSVQQRPFKAFEIYLDNGQKYLISHPENILITNTLIVTVDEQGKAVLIAPEAISSICFVDEET